MSFLLSSASNNESTDAFVQQQHSQQRESTVTASSETTTTTPTVNSSSARTAMSSSQDDDPTALRSTPDDDDVHDASLQWNLFLKYHARGSYKGIWTTYNYMGDIVDETVASVNLEYMVPNHDSSNGHDDDDAEHNGGGGGGYVQHSHHVVVGARRSDCATCFKVMDIQSIPIATYQPSQMRKMRLVHCGLVNGPTLLRNGSIATELVLSHGDGRIRVILYYGPVWDRMVEPGSCPPQGLKLYRVMVSREALRDQPPTPQSEETAAAVTNFGDTNQDVELDHVATKTIPQTINQDAWFYRPVPPFDWHKQWAGTSWTWGPTTGHRGWTIQQLGDGSGIDAADEWHGNAPVELWNLRLPAGGIFCQTPRILSPNQVGLCRLAWLPNTDTMLRLEAGVIALQPILRLDEDDNQHNMVEFEPPSLVSLRCDVLQNMGNLEGDPMFVRERRANQKEGMDRLNRSTTNDDDNENILQ